MENWTLTILGGGAVGKTALLIQEFDPTIEDSYRALLVVDNRLCHLDMIDTAGGEEYAGLREHFIRKTQGIILVYSVASRSSFENLEDFHQSILNVEQRNSIILMLVGNQCDRTQERQVSKADGAALARQYGCGFIETSAKTTQNVERLFINAVRSLRQTKDTEKEPRKSAKKKRKPLKCVIM